METIGTLEVLIDDVATILVAGVRRNELIDTALSEAAMALAREVAKVEASFLRSTAEVFSDPEVVGAVKRTRNTVLSVVDRARSALRKLDRELDRVNDVVEAALAASELRWLAVKESFQLARLEARMEAVQALGEVFDHFAEQVEVA